MDWTIGTIAHLARVTVETVRYYERIGLLARPHRKANSFRKYPAEALERVRFIKRAQWLGFSLEEIAKLLSLSETRPCSRGRELGESKLELLRHKIEELIAVQSTLESLLARCVHNTADGCPLVDALRGDMDVFSASAKQAPADRSRTPVVRRNTPEVLRHSIGMASRKR